MTKMKIVLSGGLVPVVVQDWLTGDVRMVAYASPEAAKRTLETRKGTFYSRSRSALWEKGATSGNALDVRGVATDCDADTLLYAVDPRGPTCHTGRESCFFREVRAFDASDDALSADAGEELAPQTALARLEATIAVRRDAGEPGTSYTSALLTKGAAAIGAKIREEADEVARALEGEGDERVASEAADVLYHLLVGLAARRVPVRAVLAELERRSGTSGHTEKASRTRG